MASWTLKISRGVVKDLRDLPKEARGRAALAILELAADPHPPGAEKLKGYDQTYRIRVGDYRIVYETTETDVTIIAVSHRKEVYRDLN